MFIEEIELLKTLKTDKFLNGLMENENGNIILEVTGLVKGTITLSYTHRPTRNENSNKSIKKSKALRSWQMT